MLLPDNMHPEYSIYYNGGIVLSCLQNKQKQDLFELFKNVKECNDISFSVFLLSLDWLYLIDLAKYNNGGEIELCS